MNSYTINNPMNSSTNSDSIDFRNICRACMRNDSEMIGSLFLGGLAEMYTTCTALKVSELDPLPHNMCVDCAKLLKTLHNFRLKCHTSEATFKVYLKKSKLKSLSSSPNIDKSVLETDQYFEIKLENGIDPCDFDIPPEYDDLNTNSDSKQDMELSSNNFISPFEYDNETLENKSCRKKNLKSRKTKHWRIEESKRALKGKGGQCKFCKKTFAYSTSLRKHKLSCNKSGKMIKNVYKSKENEIPSSNPTSHFICGLCPNQYETQELLNTHLEYHKHLGIFQCKICPFQGVDWADFLTHRYSHQPEGYKIEVKCWACTNRFSVVERLEYHVRQEHLGKLPGLCKICHKEFSSVNNLRAHQFIHSGIKPRKCKVCGKGFVYRRSLALHMRCHSDVKKYICHTCGNTFKFATGLVSHQFRMHSDVQMMICSHCGKAFKNRETLREHLLRVTSVKDFECTECNKKYRTQKELDYHSKWHSDVKPFQCCECGKGYKSNSHLISHMRQHTGERPYHCDLCTKSFMTSYVLKKHRMIHTGEKPHVCEICTKAFVEKSNLKNHMKTHK